ncbi:MAG: DUF624 domain-containing protein [Hamadaea sp.]|uniref:YesL family protein n=1 Tax=Hamadaea sp. TaxID=2024425 RepID=UPI0017DC8399|nr:DUF624 domain-containing protein [Hamadaea sp.]NUR73829.1 DUF624 domain-containing protein [Hamadaea sp.]NUT19006.1 DUF624 domain-containing protein [Hamadaea sp.]
MTTSAWSVRLYEATDELLWSIKLTLIWLLFTLIGGVVLGAGPATLAAYTVARRHARNESFHIWPAFTAAYRRDFGRGQLTVLPLAGAALLLVTNYHYFAAMGPGGSPARVATGVALVLLLVVAAYLLPMLVHYDLRPFAYLPKASLFALTRPGASALLLLVLSALAFAVQLFPLLAVAAIGGWIQLDTWLCLRFFAENEARLQSKGLS